MSGISGGTDDKFAKTGAIEVTHSFDPLSPIHGSAPRQRKKGKQCKKTKNLNDIFKKMKRRGQYEQIVNFQSPVRSSLNSPGDQMVLQEQNGTFEFDNELSDMNQLAGKFTPIIA